MTQLYLCVCTKPIMPMGSLWAWQCSVAHKAAVGWGSFPDLLALGSL